MTDLSDEKRLERRVVATRTRLVDTIDALERRGARIVATVNDARRIFTLVADGAAVLGAVSTLLALLRSTRHAERFETAPRRRPHVLGHITLLAVLAGVAYVARRTSPAAPRRSPMRTPRLRAIS